MKANLDDIYLFSQTVLHEGISAAAHANGLQRSKVSRRLRMLEEALGTELLIRTTRNIELTTQGKELFALTKQPLEQILEGVNALAGDLDELSGKLRIAIPSALMSTNLFNNILTEYIETYPDINIEVENYQEGVDLKRQSFDIQVLPSVVKVADTSYVQFSILPYRCHLVASPDYLARHNKISSPLDLKEHRILTNRYNADLLAPHLNIALKSDDLYVLLNMATSGTGIAFLPKVNTRISIEQGALVEVLTGMNYPEQHLTLIYPSSSYLPRKVKALIDIFREKYS
ncbi:LysR family transcriptional regulator [Thalassotalea euphylliae]|uniref:LysR family transcriptional regulator n=1 Tax=Thalassotalea euphylliae TaxID=1655234 RepID=A0A3E0TJF0_9GAMM|nr:LysR family transcriptional regulator [Thalassotalea euphylliae]REL24400.1 LysR family transcriptional regulator [Thalassotalea euphylliae]